ncbi:acyl-CoA dehydrogenase family protein [Lysinibacillus parviboronicapiens]|uniref:acyl-CoA dehydrogenase family protein n=1 Tax=Lysinibacillus parviboronicapiens TaxID=436516 RepID=UPI000D3C3663|nr:acyl-CoA dehydrogenase family protein [Lysinibacillus parviboronicapiens]
MSNIQEKSLTQDILTKLDDIIVDFVAPNAAHIDRERAFPRENINEIGRNGLLGLLIPQQLGGLEAPLSLYKETVIRLAQACASTALVYVQHMSAVSILLYGKDSDYIKKILSKIAQGNCLTTIALSEAGSGCYFFLPVSQVRNTDNGLRLKTNKIMVTSAGVADLYVINSKATFAKNSMQSNFFAVSSNYDGIEVGGTWEGMGLRGNQSAPLNIDAYLNPEMLIGEEGEGFKITREALLPMGQIGISAVNIGIAKAIYNESVNYVKKRFYTHINTNLSDFQSIQQMVGEMKVLCDQAETALNAFVQRMENKEIDMVSTLEVKVMACQMVLSVAEIGLKVCGGHAYSANTPIERYIRDSMAGTVMGPTPDVLKELIGKIVLDVPTQL